LNIAIFKLEIIFIIREGITLTLGLKNKEFKLKTPTKRLSQFRKKIVLKLKLKAINSLGIKGTNKYHCEFLFLHKCWKRDSIIPLRAVEYVNQKNAEPESFIIVSNYIFEHFNKIL
jgi:hypothetical protein